MFYKNCHLKQIWESFPDCGKHINYHPPSWVMRLPLKGAGEEEPPCMFPEEGPEPQRGNPFSLAWILSSGPFTVISFHLGIFFGVKYMSEGVIRYRINVFLVVWQPKLWKPYLLLMPEKHPVTHLSAYPRVSLCLPQVWAALSTLCCSSLSTTVSSDTSSGKNSSGKCDIQGHPHTHS